MNHEFSFLVPYLSKDTAFSRLPGGQRITLAGKRREKKEEKMQINIQKILVVKNNKVFFPRNSHVGKITLQDGSLYGYIIRIEARSFRRSFINGTNSWDIFYVLSDWGWIKIIFVHLDTMPNDAPAPDGIEIASRDGKKTIMTLRRVVETPLGIEEEDQLFSVSWLLSSELTEEEKRIVNVAVRDAREEGFGPHGEILSNEFPFPIKEVKEVHSDTNGC
jgi:hypothetical protein